MHLIAKHPLWFLIFGLALVLSVVALLGHSGSTPASSATISISGGGELIDPGISPSTPLPASPSPTPSGPTIAYTPILFGSSTETGTSPTPTEVAATQQNNPTAANSTDSGQTLLQQVYGLLSAGTTAQTTFATRTSSQDALYKYANEAGLALLTFDDTHANSTEVLKTWLSARSDSTVSAGVVSLGNDMITTGQEIAALTDVPPAAAAINANFAASLQAAGTKMLAVASAGTDDTKLTSALQAYDTAADGFTTSYLAVVDLLSLSGVKFGSTDPGAVFSFSSSGTP